MSILASFSMRFACSLLLLLGRATAALLHTAPRAHRLTAREATLLRGRLLHPQAAASDFGQQQPPQQQPSQQQPPLQQQQQQQQQHQHQQQLLEQQQEQQQQKMEQQPLQHNEQQRKQNHQQQQKKAQQEQQLLHQEEVGETRLQGACAADGGAFWDQYQKLHRTERSRVLIYRRAPGAGLGNSFRGMAVAMYIAMATKRAFFMEPNTDFGTEASDPFPGRIDWRTANQTFEACSGGNRVHVVKGYSTCTRRQGGGSHCMEADEAVSDTTPCLVMETNALPSSWLEHMDKAHPDLVAPLHRAVPQPEFVMGCALHFLLDFSGLLAARRSTATKIGPPGTPSSYVALHMRFGDHYLRSGGELWADHKEQIRAALLCAQDLGESLFTADQRWGIFFASDSQEARQYVSSEAPSHNISAFENEFEPMHTIDATRGQRKNTADHFWNTWADFLTILGAEGLVSAGGEYSSQQDHKGNRNNGFSDYSQTPVQIARMPFSRQRVVLLRAQEVSTCMPVTPADVNKII